MAQQNYGPVSRSQAISDILESVAREQQALAGILEKATQKPGYLQDPDCYSYFDDAQKPDKKDGEKQIELINAITRLEFLLVFKSSLFINCTCPNEG